MATNVPKSYQPTIKHPPPRPSRPSEPAGPGQSDHDLPPELIDFRDLVLEGQEIIRQFVKVSGPQIKFTVQYEMSVIEFTP